MEILNIIVIAYLAILVIGVMTFFVCMAAESQSRILGLFGMIAMIILGLSKYYLILGGILGAIYLIALFL